VMEADASTGMLQPSTKWHNTTLQALRESFLSHTHTSQHFISLRRKRKLRILSSLYI